MLSLTYGTLPPHHLFVECFDLAVPSSFFHFGNDPRMGNCALTEGQLWSEIQKACREWEKGDDTAGDWVSCVLSVLGIEWV